MKRLKKMSNENNGKYNITSGGTIDEFQGSKSANDPEEAVKIWCEMQGSSPMNVSIIAKSADSIELLNWAKNNKEKLLEMLTAQNIYKPEKFIEELDKSSGVREFYDKYGGDQVYPFCMG